MKDYMEISAKAAHEVSLRVNEETVTEIKCAIMNEIQDARLNGDYDIWVRYEGKPYENLNKEHICDEISGWLLGLGFELHTTEDYKTTILQVSWANVEQE